MVGLPAAQSVKFNPLSVNCVIDLAERAAERARAEIPGIRDTISTRQRALGFLRHNMQNLFDPDRTGYLDLNRWKEYQWSAVLVTLPPGQCRLSFRDYVLVGWGPEKAADDMLRAQSFLKQSFRDSFNWLDKDRKGYLTKEDFDSQSAGSFRAADKNHDGKVTFEEYDDPDGAKTDSRGSK